MRSLLAMLAACGGSSLTVDAPVADTPPPPVVERHALGMSDISMLFPLPTALDQPVVSGIAPLIDVQTFSALVQLNGEIAPKSNALVNFTDFQVVALRFDPCDGFMIGPCADFSDGRLRLVLQPVYQQNPTTIAMQDIAVHAFYPIPHDELSAVVRELRALARIANSDPSTPLAVNTGVANAEYLARLRALIAAYCNPQHLIRLTVSGQELNSGAFAWIFRGVERPAFTAAFTAMTIPQILKPQQSAQLTGGDVVYNNEPMVPQPSLITLAMNGVLWATASDADKRTALVALDEVQNPMLHDALDTQCVSCHLAHYLTGKRAGEANVDMTTLPTYWQTTRNVWTDPAGIGRTDERSIRAFGYEASYPAISQRVANDTAKTLDIIDARFAP